LRNFDRQNDRAEAWRRKVRSPGRPYLPITDRPGAALSIPNLRSASEIPITDKQPPMPMIRLPCSSRLHPARPAVPSPARKAPTGANSVWVQQFAVEVPLWRAGDRRLGQRSPHSCERRTCRTNSIIPQCIAKAKKSLTNPAWISGFSGARDDTRLSASIWEKWASGPAQILPHFDQRPDISGR
jgi:hypothetical protein